MQETDQHLIPGEVQGKVLYIEDQESSLVLVEAMLTSMPGVRLIKASTGAKGIDLARSGCPDLVLLDMYLPDVSGVDVVRNLSIEISRGLKIVILTGDTFSVDVVKAMSLGAKEYWVKPIEPQRFRLGVAKWLLRANAKVQEPPHAS
ncbi:MAG: response regulator [Burkholderiaceae bacterium]|nr:response regulator [Burkholderiaceae bacterium]